MAEKLVLLGAAVIVSLHACRGQDGGFGSCEAEGASTEVSWG